MFSEKYRTEEVKEIIPWNHDGSVELINSE